MKENELPIVFIGTGPVSLLKAYLTARKNPEKSILILDNNPTFGGAWYSDLRSDGSEIESGCHIWSYNKKVYDYLARELALEMVKMKPAPLFVKGKLKVPYSIKNTIDSYKYLIKKLVRFDFKVFSQIKQSEKYTFKIFGKQNKYAEFGSVDLVKALKKRIESTKNIKIERGVKVERIELSEDAKYFVAGISKSAEKIFMTSVTDLKEISTESEKIPLSQRQVDYIHFLVKLNQPLRKKMSYWRLTDDKIIHRISDISYQTRFSENLCLIGIKQDAFEGNDEAALLEHCQKTFIKLGLIEQSEKLLLEKTYVYPTFYIDIEQRKKISSLNPSKLELLHSTDLMYGFHALLKIEGILI